jgi:hypothetical protein
MSDRLFQIVALLHPTEKEREETGTRSTILLPVECVIARDESEARLIAARKLPQEATDKLDRVEIGVRPF